MIYELILCSANHNQNFFFSIIFFIFSLYEFVWVFSGGKNVWQQFLAITDRRRAPAGDGAVLTARNKERFPVSGAATTSIRISRCKYSTHWHHRE